MLTSQLNGSGPIAAPHRRNVLLVYPRFSNESFWNYRKSCEVVGARYVDSGLLFTWPDGRPIHPARFSQWFQQHVVTAGLPR